MTTSLTRSPALAVSLLTRQFRRLRDDSRSAAANSVDDRLRRLLEEAGVRCESARLEDLAAFLLSSPRGMEIVLSDKLTATEKANTYAHLLAHAIITGDERPVKARFEYFQGRRPARMSGRERREEAVASALARVMIEGRLERAPRLLYDRGAPAPTKGTAMAARGALLAILHYFSLALYWRSSSYKTLRGLSPVTGLVCRVQSILGEREPAAA